MKRIVWTLVLLLAFFAPTGVKASHLPDSGQTTCYNSSGSAVSCSGTGQDGSYTINPLSYTDNGETISDNHTGLVWRQQDDGNTYNWYKATGTYHPAHNPSTQNVCADLGSGWYLPSTRELLGLAKLEIAEPGPTIDSVFTNTHNSYWASETLARYSTSALNMSFYEGKSSSRAKSSLHYVRCVQGGFPASGFTDNGDGTVTDSVTGLMWQQAETTSKSWSSALSYCEGLTLGNMTDWRLPNVKELETLVDYSAYNPALDTTYFPNGHAYHYWSSTTLVTYPTFAWTVTFADGFTSSSSKSTSVYVKCVRGLQKWPLSGAVGSRTILLGFGDDGQESCGEQVKKHVGIDIEAEEDEIVYAAESGVVKAAQLDQDWGGWVTLEHSGPYTTVYWHIAPSVSVNDTVEKGDPIGTIVNYGGPMQLHFGMRNGAYSNTSNREALPQSSCGGDPSFPENFVNPETLSYE